MAAIGTTGGTYPVSVSLSGCTVANTSSHWDFIFQITAALQSGTDCNCSHLRVTLFDNPPRTRLWISNGFGSLSPLTGSSDNPQNRTENDPRLYVQKVLAAGQTASFPFGNAVPSQSDVVTRVAGPPWTGFVTGGTVVGTISAPGTADDSVHTLMLPNGSVPCDLTGPMAYYRVECGQSPTGPWTLLVDEEPLNPCVPMISATVCRFSTAGDDLYRVRVSVLTLCPGIQPSSFAVTNIQRNNSTDFPNQGNSVWSGSRQLSAGVTNIDMTDDGNDGGQLWISFTTDGGVNTSRIRVPTSNVSC